MLLGGGVQARRLSALSTHSYYHITTHYYYHITTHSYYHITILPYDHAY